MCKLAAVSKKCKKNTVLWRNTNNFKGVLIQHIFGKTPAKRLCDFKDFCRTKSNERLTLKKKLLLKREIYLQLRSINLCKSGFTFFIVSISVDWA